MTFAIPITWLILALPFCVATVLASYKAACKRTTNKKRHLAVVGLNIAAYAALLLLLFDPQTTDSEPLKVTVITDQDALPDEAQKFETYSAPWLSKAVEGAPRLPSISALPHIANSPDTVHLLGYGLREADWQKLDSRLKIEWDTPRDAPTGIIDVRWPKVVYVGDTWTVTGTFEASQAAEESEIFKIALADPAGREISMQKVRAGGRFSLSASTPLPGPITYTLEVTDRESTELDKEHIALSVTSPVTTKILLLQSAPGFEARHFSAWAHSYGAQITALSTVSKGRYIIAGSTEPAAASEGMLQSFDFSAFDIVVMDGRAYSDLTDTQRLALDTAIVNGLGLFIQADSALVQQLQEQPDNLLTGISLVPSESRTNAVRPQWPTQLSESDVALPTLPVSAYVEGWAPLVGSEQKGPVSVVKSYGLGRIAVSWLRQSYAWVLAGNKGIYSSYWTYIAGKVGRTTGAARLIPHADNLLPRLGDRLANCGLVNNVSASVQIEHVGAKLTQTQTLAADRFSSDRACSFFEPQNTGWYRRSLLNTDGKSLDSDYFYVFDNNDWAANFAWERRTATKLRVGAQKPDQLTKARVNTRSLFSSALLGILFIVCACLLWTERKLAS
ncbi:hypothetical protein [Kordiimonas gwangyangensis]|uniref:hypothetical protein n=1 Tax=Kordiimonas gwangyangensis TaxID=288022 RepID=UPI000364212E|nr:hypothetical protein [Kordiimonas gwangyangensis]